MRKKLFFTIYYHVLIIDKKIRFYKNPGLQTFITFDLCKVVLHLFVRAKIWE